MGIRVDGPLFVLSLYGCPAHSADDNLRVSWRRESAFRCFTDLCLIAALRIHTHECPEVVGIPWAWAHVPLRFVVLVSHT